MNDMKALRGGGVANHRRKTGYRHPHRHVHGRSGREGPDTGHGRGEPYPYGPVSGLASGDSATVNEDGTLNLKGPQGNVWGGLKWVCDINRFIRGGTVTVSAEGLPTGSEVMLRFNDRNDSAHSFIYPARDGYASTGVVPSDAKAVFVAVRRAGKYVDLNAARVSIMVNEGETALPWVRPDVTNAPGESMS